VANLSRECPFQAGILPTKVGVTPSFVTPALAGILLSRNPHYSPSRNTSSIWYIFRREPTKVGVTGVE